MTGVCEDLNRADTEAMTPFFATLDFETNWAAEKC